MAFSYFFKLRNSIIILFTFPIMITVFYNLHHLFHPSLYPPPPTEGFLENQGTNYSGLPETEQLLGTLSGKIKSAPSELGQVGRPTH